MKKTSFGHKILKFHSALPKDLALSPGVEIIYPFDEQEVIRVMRKFYAKYYNDERGRAFIFGINPGRFGSGITGIGFTDPRNLELKCDIANDFQKRSEFSSDFIYEMIGVYGGPDLFFKRFYLTAVSPVGFIKAGKNYNYYDDSAFNKKLSPFLVSSIKAQLSFGQSSPDIICIGRGKNLKFLQHLNARHKLFEQIHVVPHPRWVMQYKRKEKAKYIDQYLLALDKMLARQ